MDNSPLRIDFARLCAERGLRVAQPGERHYRSDWICLPCPFCTGKNEGNHLGFNPQSNVFSCFRCGRHGKFETLGALLGISKKEAGNVAKEYAFDLWSGPVALTQKDGLSAKVGSKEISEDAEQSTFELPGVRKLLRLHRVYLAGRGFDPDRITRTWDIRCTGGIGFYSYRIVVPITYGGKVVSFIARDVTGEAADRYLACKPELALRHHKYCVYGFDQSPFKTCIVVEGNFGVWRIGAGAVGTCGTGWTHEQAKLIAKFQKSYIFFDPEEDKATERAYKLQEMLEAYRDHKSYVIEAEGANGRDTGELTKEERKEVRRLLK